MEDNKENKIFEFENKKYNLKVGFNEKNKLLKLTMIDIETKEEKAINISGIRPQGATPDNIVLDDTVSKDLMEELINRNIILESNGLFARVSFKSLYDYDPEGVKEFLDFHTHTVEYEEEGKTANEVKKDIRRYTEKQIRRKDVKKYLEDYVWSTETEKYLFMYSLLNKENPQSSVITYCDKDGEFYLLIRPYEKRFDDKFEIVPEWAFNYYGGMMCLLDNRYEIIDINKYVHCSIWEEVEDALHEPKNDTYKKGVEKYIKYCKKNNITKDSIAKTCNYDDFSSDIMKYYKTKSKER